MTKQEILDRFKDINEAYNDSSRYDSLSRMLDELLKEQEAVEPNPVHNSFRWFACGKCDCSITREDRFCPRCGRPVKWDA